jgi:polyhydroxybutyrate depolymerase
LRSVRSRRRFVRVALALVGSSLVATALVAAGTQQRPSADVPAECRDAVQQAGRSTRHQISSGGREREFVVHVPEGYDGATALPVVLVFHGRGRDGAHMERVTKLSRLPAVVVYPDGVVNEAEDDRSAWQGAPYAAPGVDDVAFTAGMIDYLRATMCADPTRVYATGFSNGGGFVGLLACRMADRIAAFAPVAGAFYPETGENCHPGRPVPMLEFHGRADSRLPYEGDEPELPAVPDWMAVWAGRNGCHEQPTDARIEPDVTVSTWSGCTDQAEVRLVTVDDGGHTWPGADSPNGVGGTTQTIEAHEVIWDFVRGYELPAIR